MKLIVKIIPTVLLVMAALAGCQHSSEKGCPGYVTITSTPVEQAIVGKQWKYQADAFSSLEIAVTWSLEYGPSGMTRSGNWLYWTPNAGQIGWSTVTLMVTDGMNEYRQHFKIHVIPDDATNHAPVFTSAPKTTAYAAEGYQYDAGATDIDADGLIFEIAYKEHAGITINSASGVVSWTPTADLAGNSFEVVLTVKDDVIINQLFDEQQFSITVYIKPTGPEIVSPMKSTANVGIEYSHPAFATDADSDPLIYMLAIYPDGMSINSSTGLVTWTPSAEQIGDSPVILRVSDGMYTDAMNFTITTLPGNATQFTSVPTLSATANTEWTYAPMVTGNAAALTFSLETNPAAMTVDAGTGELSWTPASGDVGFHAVVLTADDGAYPARQSFVIDVGE